MTSLVEAGTVPVGRTLRTRHFLMCPPRYFEVRYAINPWMDPSRSVSPQRALGQWTMLVEEYARVGHRVDLLDPVPGLPDMVFAANGATVVDGFTLAARFARPERAAEAAWHTAWHRRHGVDYGLRELRAAYAVNEAEGDFAVHAVPPATSTGPAALTTLTTESPRQRVLAGYGFRTQPAAHGELARLSGSEVVSLELVDPRFYHLDVALAVLDDLSGLIAYYPPAFSAQSRQDLERLYPDAVIATEADALAFGLNLVSDGLNVFTPVGAEQLSAGIERLGFQVVPVDLTELILAGGSVKCCTQELRPAPGRTSVRPMTSETSRS